MYPLKDRLSFETLIKDNIKKNIIFLVTWNMSTSDTRVRLRIVSIFFLIFFCILSYRLLNTATHDYDSGFKSHIDNKLRKEIVDRNNVVLAVNLPSSSLFATPTKVINPAESLDKLSTILPNLEKKRLLRELRSNKSFVWIERDVMPKEEEIIFNLGLVGFDFEREQKRIYTFSNLLSHILGYVGRDLTGLAGLERSYNGFLSSTQNDQKSNNKPLTLSIDVRLQGIVDEELDNVIREFRAKSGTAIVVNPNNGEILALVNKPDFDPHYPGRAKPEQLFNTASLGVYEMGSVFKAITLAIGFDTNTITMNDLYDLTHLKVTGNIVKDYHKTTGWHSIPEIFLHSSNIGTSQIISEIGERNIKKYFKQLGLLYQLNIELAEKAKTLYPDIDKKWSDITLATMSFGYGLSISPLHFVRAMLPVVNGGILYDLTLIKKEGQKFEGKRVFTENTSKQMSKLMRLVVQEGTGRKAEIAGYYIGGKTGTAEKLLAGKYSKNTRMSSFIATLPALNPRYMLYITLDEPKPTKDSFGFATAGWNAVPATKRIFERMISLYGIEPINITEVEDIININYKVDNAI